MMKYLLNISFCILTISLFGQTNIFPSSGYVGVGTTSPLNGIHVFSNGDLNGGSVRFGYSGAADALLSFGWDGVSQDAFKISKFPHNSITGSTNFLTILSNTGNVGIGTTSPQAMLDVNGNIQISNASIPIGLMTEVGGTTPLLNMSVNFRESNKNNSYRGAAFRIDTRNGVPLFQWLTRSANTTTENIPMALTENGNLGIGTQYPNSKLQVNIGSNLNWNVTTGSNGLTVSLRALNDAANGFVPGEIEASTLNLNANSGGNVLIGKTSQVNTNYKLDVAGNIRANKLVVNTTGADFVFAKKYHLIPLDALEKYIQQYKHLPGIEPAREMSKDGMDVGNNETKLLQKIEELTLYMIEMKKENERLENKVEVLNKRITEIGKEKKK